MKSARIQRRFKSYHGKKTSTKRENPIPVNIKLNDFKLIRIIDKIYKADVHKIKKNIAFSGKHPGSSRNFYQRIRQISK